MSFEGKESQAKTIGTSDAGACSTFEPADPWKSEELKYRRRNLPHLELPNATYFVTFRCRSGQILESEARDPVMSGIKACDGRMLEVFGAVVMPDHAHLIFRINHGTLGSVMQRIKGGLARRVNVALKRKGSLWMDESFDHVVRSEEELREKVEYIRNNPVKKGLVDIPEEYRWLFVRQGITG